mmetsp:Transcript_46831/g.142175  ORF Transcript_46831/g.142175 Transcript_46831/m.142175 type:complete len:287 (+) Transcript_46831:403-1263(+)
MCILSSRLPWTAIFACIFVWSNFSCAILTCWAARTRTPACHSLGCVWLLRTSSHHALPSALCFGSSLRARLRSSIDDRRRWCCARGESTYTLGGFMLVLLAPLQPVPDDSSSVISLLVRLAKLLRRLLRWLGKLLLQLAKLLLRLLLSALHLLLRLNRMPGPAARSPGPPHEEPLGRRCRAPPAPLRGGTTTLNCSMASLLLRCAAFASLRCAWGSSAPKAMPFRANRRHIAARRALACPGSPAWQCCGKSARSPGWKCLTKPSTSPGNRISRRPVLSAVGCFRRS